MTRAVRHCCERMAWDLARTCPRHPDRFDCPDALVDYSAKGRRYGLIVHDGGRSVVEIRHCPWCGSRLGGA